MRAWVLVVRPHREGGLVVAEWSGVGVQQDDGDTLSEVHALLRPGVFGLLGGSVTSILIIPNNTF